MYVNVQGNTEKNLIFRAVNSVRQVKKIYKYRKLLEQEMAEVKQVLQ